MVQRTSQNGEVNNQYFDDKGNVLYSTDRFDGTSEDDQQPYDDLLFYSDDFDMIRLNLSDYTTH